jgi:hypothetical protein
VAHGVPCTLRIELDGYEPVVIHRNKILSGWFVAGIFLAGWVSVVVDAATDNMEHHSSDPVWVQLRGLSDGGPTGPAVRMPMVPVAMATRPSAAAAHAR